VENLHYSVAAFMIDFLVFIPTGWCLTVYGANFQNEMNGRGNSSFYGKSECQKAEIQLQPNSSMHLKLILIFLPIVFVCWVGNINCMM
jgi:hypothetical protein